MRHQPLGLSTAAGASCKAAGMLPRLAMLASMGAA
eukprot:CAMPEP_0182890686 /NCGR_PEP_ID=MMETSP0034_2-20130328/22812_1 /TAXON_ID=156128 /ORGANISM="Nephroselmis pyriformis, Strain CCMP717" /LENGTH=34 /DNA_ID= /DNA_START= /DNA_END= /DNA_ORIENTATION=